ncbi:trans-L-3-hydroxyproline dehydratase [Aureococcus anophagefferens]|nr:trans-L-3-hydroxyproline dehydratase [Aureococcus anophagefferens]
MFAKRAHVMERMDRWREVLLHEPRLPLQQRGLLVEPTLAGADAGFVIAEQAKIYPLMSATTRSAPRRRSSVAGAAGPAGVVPARGARRAIPIADVAADGRCERVTFGGTPSFVGKRGGRAARVRARRCQLPATELEEPPQARAVGRVVAVEDTRSSRKARVFVLRVALRLGRGVGSDRSGRPGASTAA